MIQSSHIATRVTPIVAIFAGVAAIAFRELVPLLALILAVTATITGVITSISYRHERLNLTLALASAALGVFSLVFVLARVLPLLLAYQPNPPMQ